METAAIPKVSVIIPAHNASLFIAETISSVLAQSMPDLELIIIDDGSVDDMDRIIQDFSARDRRVRSYTQKRSGVSVARNRGIKESRGAYIAFLDHDDLWVPGKLEKQLDIFRKDTDLGLVFSRASIITENGKQVGLTGGGSKLYRGRVFKELFREHFVCLSSVLIKKDVFDRLDEWFDESMEMAEEIDLFLRIAYGWKIDYCEEILAKWRMHPDNDSRLRRGLLISDYRKIIERLKERVPDFERKYKKEMDEKQRWIAIAEIEVLLSEKNKKTAIGKMFLFFRSFGPYPGEMVKLFLLFTLGFNIYDKIRMRLLGLYNKINMRTMPAGEQG